MWLGRRGGYVHWLTFFSEVVKAFAWPGTILALLIILRVLFRNRRIDHGVTDARCRDRRPVDFEDIYPGSGEALVGSVMAQVTICDSREDGYSPRRQG